MGVDSIGKSFKGFVALILLMFSISIIWGAWEQSQRSPEEKAARIAYSRAAAEQRNNEKMASAYEKTSQSRLIEYRSLVGKLEAHQSSVCRRIVDSVGYLLAGPYTKVSDDSETVYKGVLDSAERSRCL